MCSPRVFFDHEDGSYLIGHLPHQPREHIANYLLPHPYTFSLCPFAGNPIYSSDISLALKFHLWPTAGVPRFGMPPMAVTISPCSHDSSIILEENQYYQHRPHPLV